MTITEQSGKLSAGGAPGQVRPFNPNEHLMQIKSGNQTSDYLAVQWRLVWFRSVCPHGTIDTEELAIDLDRECEAEVPVWNDETRRREKKLKKAKGYARYRAVVTDGEGGRATGTKSERAVDFPDFVEKAETGAIGRALAALGYGTQFTGEEFDERHRIVDAPVERPALEDHTSDRPVARANGRAKATHNGNQKPPEEGNPKSPMTEQQWASICKLCQYLHKDVPSATDAMNYLAAKELITQLSQEYRQNRTAKAS